MSVGGPYAAWLDQGRRLHLQHGPIDLIIEASGAVDQTRLAYDRAWARFQTVLSGLVAELPRLRSLCPPAGLGVRGPIARRMERAVRPFAAHGITPMAAVAGAVADEMLTAMTKGLALERACVNNGGDIALVLKGDRRYRIAIVGRPHNPVVFGRIELRAGDPVGGIATSGRHGRSHSLGIADSVTVLAKTAAGADAAATLIANAVDLPGHPGIRRVPARDLDPDSDLGSRLVTVDVAPLDPAETSGALDAGVGCAEAFHRRKTIAAAVLCLDDQIRLIGDMPSWSVSAAPPMVALPPRPLMSMKETRLA